MGSEASWWEGLAKRLPPSLARSANTIRRDFKLSAETFRADLYRELGQEEGDRVWAIFERTFLG